MWTVWSLDMRLWVDTWRERRNHFAHILFSSLSSNVAYVDLSPMEFQFFRQDRSGDGQLLGQQAPRGPRASEEDPRAPRPSSLLGRPRARSTHQDHWQKGQDRRCLQEEVELFGRVHVSCSTAKRRKYGKYTAGGPRFIGEFMCQLVLNYAVS